MVVVSNYYWRFVFSVYDWTVYLQKILVKDSPFFLMCVSCRFIEFLVTFMARQSSQSYIFMTFPSAYWNINVFFIDRVKRKYLLNFRSLFNLPVLFHTSQACIKLQIDVTSR